MKSGEPMQLVRLSIVFAFVLLIFGGCRRNSEYNLGADQDHLRILRDNLELGNSLDRAIQAKTSIHDIEKMVGKATINTLRDNMRELEIHSYIEVYRNEKGNRPDLWNADAVAYWIVPPRMPDGSYEIIGLIWVGSRIERFTGFAGMP